MNLVEGLQSEIQRTKELQSLYNEIPTGVLGARIIESTIKNAEAALAAGDVVDMCQALKSLQELE